MKTKSLIAASLIAVLASGAAFAQDDGDSHGYNPPEFSLPSTKTRAQVQAEVIQAQARGELRVTSEGYGYAPASTFASTKTRDEVRAEVIKALKAGEHFSQGERG